VRYLIVAFLGLTAALPPAVAQDRFNEPLRAELLEMGRRDQQVREKLIPLAFSARSGPPSQEAVALIAEQDQVEDANLRRLEEIVTAYGWPGKNARWRRGQ